MKPYRYVALVVLIGLTCADGLLAQESRAEELAQMREQKQRAAKPYDT
jgi:hypothetical protein